jgi:adenosylmethionine-8-amino-7-oxononanoate aminotransferase
MSGTVDGKMGDHVLLAPPYIINYDEIRSIAALVAESIDEVLDSSKG